MMPLPTARLSRAAGSASGGRNCNAARDRHSAAAGFAFWRLAAFGSAMVLAACGTAPVSEEPAAAPSPSLSTATPAPAARPAGERPAELREDRGGEPAASVPPVAGKPTEARPRPERVPESSSRPTVRAERRGADAIPLAPPAAVERRETPALPPLPPLPRVARESVPQVRAGDDVVALAVEHGFDPVPVAVPDNTRFSRLRIGMTKQDAEALLGRPDAALHYANEGARIPFYASDDSSRWETFYRGQGRLLFSGAWLTGEVRLIRIEFDADEDGEPDPDHPQRDRR